MVDQLFAGQMIILTLTNIVVTPSTSIPVKCEYESTICVDSC